MNKTKLFISAAFDSKHGAFSEEEATYRLRNDVRSKILGDVKCFLRKPKKNKSLSYNPDIIYVGGYYYYDDYNCNTLESCKALIDIQLKELDQSDLVVVIIDRYSAISTMSELLYAAYKNKEIIIFADPKICKLDINSKYWYAIEMAKTLDDNITFINYDDIEDVKTFLKGYKKTVIKPAKKISCNKVQSNEKNIFYFMSL